MNGRADTFKKDSLARSANGPPPKIRFARFRRGTYPDLTPHVTERLQLDLRGGPRAEASLKGSGQVLGEASSANTFWVKAIASEGKGGMVSKYLHEPEGIFLHVVVEHHISGFLPDLRPQDLEFLVRVRINIVRDPVKPEVVSVPGEALVSERIHAVNQIEFFT